MDRRLAPPGDLRRLFRACLSGAAAGLIGGTVLVGGFLLAPPAAWRPLLAQADGLDLALSLARIPIAFAMIGLAVGPVMALTGSGRR